MILSLIGLLSTLAVNVPAGGEPTRDPRPSILFVIADDWSWPHAGAYGDKVVRTPTFDRIAREGILFARSFCAASSCTPSRGAILSGQAIHRLDEGGNLWSVLPARIPVYPDILEAAGYKVGLQGKGWGPGTEKGGGRTRNPAGPRFKSFEEFLGSVPEGKPFCFWFGSQDPHRPYDEGSGRRSGLRVEDVRVPPFLPDVEAVRSDILDYYAEVERFDGQIERLLQALEKSGRAAGTMVVVTSDNGMPFPRAKATCYEAGAHMPLAIRWPSRVKGGRTAEDLVSHADFASTFLEAAGIAVPKEMTGRSLLPILEGKASPPREEVFIERERHANVRQGNLGYPARAIRTSDFLYIRNLRPDRWPAGDPEMWKSVGPFGDVDDGPSKRLVLERREDPVVAPFFRLAFAKRPAEELYDLAKDPWTIENLAGKSEHQARVKDLRARLDRWMRETADPRIREDEDRWDRYPYLGPEAKGAKGAEEAGKAGGKTGTP
jgi:N-sulfoglucosamine sulfohydrolase